MIDRSSKLKWLLAPLPMEQFIGEFWEQKPYVIKREDSNYYRNLFTAADLDAVLEFSRPGFQDVRVVSLGEEVSPKIYRHSDGRIDINELGRFYENGSSIVIHGLHRFWRPIAEFVQELQRCLSCKVQPNAYMTPRNSRALKAHFDNHNVFILQVTGVKTWHLYHAAAICPLDGMVQPSFPRETLPEAQVIDLVEGDLIYIPRGWVHDAETSDLSSLHLTIGLHPTQWVDFLTKALLGLSLRNEELRRALPIGYLEDPNGPEALEGKLRQLAGLLQNEGAAQDAFSIIQDEFIREGLTVNDGQFISTLDRISVINLQTRLVKQPHLYCRVIPDGESVAIQFSNSFIRAPASYRAAFIFISNGDDHFSVSELPNLDDERKVVLAKRLVRDGLCAFAPTDG